MKFRYLLGSLIITIFVNHFLYDKIVSMSEVSSFIWHLHRHKSFNENTTILILGDSQLLSGLRPETIAHIEGVPIEEVLFLPRPSEQPEGILDQFIYFKGKLPKLKKLYINISPISVSQNSVTDAHKQLYFSFGKFRFEQIKNQYLRKAYFSSPYDVMWKIVIEIFPLFSLNQNSSAFASLVPSQTQFSEEISQVSKGLQSNPTLGIIDKRNKENLILDNHFSKHSNWTWRAYFGEKKLTESEPFPVGSSGAFSKRRSLSTDIFKTLIGEARRSNIEIICLDLPFSPALEADMDRLGVRKILDKELEILEFSNIIKIDTTVLSKNDFYIDFTHLNAKGRDVLHRYLTNNQK